MSSPVLLRHLCVLVEGNCNWFQFAQMTEPSPRRGHTSPGKVRDDGIDGQQRSLSDKKLQIVPRRHRASGESELRALVASNP